MFSVGHFFSLALVMTLVLARFSPAQVPLEDPPQVQKKKTTTKAGEAKRAEALKLYAQGLLSEKEDRLLEALQAYEKAAQLDPKAAAVWKKLVSLYSALDRGKDAVAASEALLKVDSGDAKTWQVYARQLRLQGQ